MFLSSGVLLLLLSFYFSVFPVLTSKTILLIDILCSVNSQTVASKLRYVV